MSKKSLLETIQMPAPCSQSWDEMTGGDAVRFCHSCGKNVHNISALTRGEAKKLVLQSADKPCIRLTRGADGSIETVNRKTYRIAKRASRFAAGVLGASLTLSAVAEAQQTAPKTNAAGQSAAKKQTNELSSEISFTILDPTDTGIPNTKVELINSKTNENFSVKSDDEGVARFGRLPRGRYRIQIASQQGFGAFTSRFIELKNAIEPNIKIELDVAGVSTGVFTFIWYENLLLHAVSQNDISAVERLIAEGANINAKERENNFTALHVAVESNSLEIVRLLLDKGAKADAKTKEKQTPLLLIDEDTTPEIVRLLVARGANVNARDEEKETALMKAADADNLEIVRVLLAAGADVNPEDEDGETALDKTSDEDIEKLLKTYGAVAGDKNDD